MVPGRLDEDTSATIDNEKCGDILHIEKEDAQSEASGVMSVSDMESSFAELDDIKYARILSLPAFLSQTWLVAMVRPTSDTWGRPSSSRTSLLSRKS